MTIPTYHSTLIIVDIIWKRNAFLSYTQFCDPFCRYLDWMNILSYDYHSAFEPAVNHHAPLYPLEEESEYNYDVELNIVKKHISRCSRKLSQCDFFVGSYSEALLGSRSGQKQVGLGYTNLWAVLHPLQP